MTDDRRRWRFLEENPAVTHAGWIPSAQDCPELAELRSEHERLLGIHAELGQAAFAAGQQFDALQEARAAAFAEGFLSGEDVIEDDAPKITEADVKEARLRADAATDALQTFARQATSKVAELAPSLHEGLDAQVAAANEKRAEAKRLLDEADRQVAGTKRLRFWLDRFTGKSVLGPYPFDEMTVPAPPPPVDLEAMLGPSSVSEVTVVHS